MTTKEYAFDQGYTKQQSVAAWEKAKVSGNRVITNLDNYGHTWEQLPIHLYRQLMERYAAHDDPEPPINDGGRND
jgi:hypothetical protein